MKELKERFRVLWLIIRYLPYYSRGTTLLIRQNTAYIRRLYSLSLYPGEKVLTILANTDGPLKTMNTNAYLGFYRKGRLEGKMAEYYNQASAVMTVLPSGDVVAKNTEAIRRFMDKKYTPLWRTLRFVPLMSSSQSGQYDKQSLAAELLY